MRRHYCEIKSQYNLTCGNICRQICCEFQISSTALNKSLFYDNRIPSTRVGTIGRSIRNALEANLSNTDWVPSNASYEEKLYEQISYYGITAYVNKNP